MKIFFEAGDILSTGILLCASSIGSGVLALPYALSQVGLVWGIAMNGLSAALSYVTVTLLMQAAHSRPRLLTYGALCGEIHPLLSWIVDIMIMILCWCAVITYLIFLGDFIPRLCLKVPEAIHPICHERERVMLLISIVLLPFIIACKSLSFLRYTSSFSLLSLGFTCVVVIIKFFEEVDAKNFISVLTQRLREDSERGMPEFGVLIKVLSISIFSFCCHANSVQIAREMKRKTPSQICKASMIQVCSLFVLYSLASGIVYLNFSRNTMQDFLTNYNENDVLIIICEVMLSFSLIMMIPICLFATLNTGMIFLGIEDGDLDHIQDQYLLLNDEKKKPPIWIRPVACIIAIGGALACAIQFPQVADVISVLSSFLVVPIMLGFPALVCRYLLTNERGGTARIIIPMILIAFTVMCIIQAILNFATAT